jgi:hypothetical protein
LFVYTFAHHEIDRYQICGLTDNWVVRFFVCAEGDDPLPGIEGLTIVGDAVLGGRLTACGHSVNGTSLCIFQVLISSDHQPELFTATEKKLKTKKLN